ncbi:phage recombination protein Bet [uncultured Desulfovibrio sp.]|uniref:phage recombination protein Bet n=1 Tax=uncultured Desulfovibrio sp. TaxID=167968 RepID=UPI002868F3C7|nr:phage recombination protein Bet [uncultured Desulfovibrio sp.]
MSNVPATQNNNSGNQAIFARFATRFGLDSNKVSGILKNTAFKTTGSQGVTDEQMAALLVVADQFNLNPFVKEIYAFPDSNGRGIVPIVPIDGWTRIANEHPQYDGVEFIYAEETVPHGGRKCPAWIEAVIYRKDRSRPTRVREYLEECAKSSGPWNSHPQRMLRHKAFMQCCRVAFSFGGVYDEDEGERIASARLVEMPNGMPASIDITPEAKALPTGEEFEAIIIQAGFGDQRDKVEAYLHVCAQHFQSSIDEVKAEAVRHPDNFIKTFPAWLKSAEQQKNGQASAASKPQDAMAEERTFPCPRKDNTPVEDEDCFHCKEREGCPSHA